MIHIWCDIRGGIQNAERCNLSANVSFVTACNYIAMTHVFAVILYSNYLHVCAKWLLDLALLCLFCGRRSIRR